MFIGGAWVAVPLLAGQGTSTTRGLDPFADWPRASKVVTRINNDTLEWDPSRPAGARYGSIGRNTLTRWIMNGVTRLYVEASEWKPEATPSHVPSSARGVAWVDLTAEGVLRRLGSWEEPLRSTMYRTNAARPSRVGHWPLEDPRGALRLTNTVAAGQAGYYRGAALGEDDAPAGAASSAVQTADGQMRGEFVAASTTAGWQVCFAMKLKALPAPASGSWTLFRWQTTNGDMWRWSATDTAFQLSVEARDGTTLFSNNTTFGAGASPTGWITCRVGVNPVSGGTVSLNQAWYMQDLGVFYFVAPSYAGTSIGALRRWWQEGSAVNDGSHFSHVLGLTGLTEDLMSVTSRNVFNGYRGETAGARFNRVLAEVGIPRFTIGTTAETQRMGPQPVATVIDVLKECVLTDAMRVDDERFDIALTMTSRRALYNQAAALTLNYAAQQVAQPFRKILGDLGAQNRVTVKSAAGGEATATRLTGTMSILPPPAGIGEKRGSIDVNAADDPGQLQAMADWHLARGTLDRPRYEEVTVDLLANPGLSAAAFAVREGNRITVTNFEPDPIDLLVVGIEESAGKTELRITYKTEPYEPYQVGVYDDPGTPPSRWDTATTTVAAAATSGAVTLQVTTVNRDDVLTTKPASLPLDLFVAGEKVRATAITAAAGSGPYTQTLTVTRALNGVVKAQPIGGRVTVADARRWGL